MKTTWNIDPMHSEIAFKVRHMMITNVNGHFASFDAKIETEGEDFTKAQFNFSADINSIDTGVSDRDAHLKSDDFFGSEQFPKLTFKSTNVSADGDDFIIQGEMSIRDITREIILKAEYGGLVIDPYGQTKVGFSITGKLLRSTFNLKWNAITEAGNVVVSDEIKLLVEAQFVKQ